MTLNTPCVLCLVNTLELIEIGIHTDRPSPAESASWSVTL